MRLKSITSVLVTCLGLLAPSLANAGQSSAVLQVSLEIVDTCEVQAEPLNFSMSRDSSTGATAQTNVQLKCTPDTEFSVSLDDGAHSAGGQRQLLNAANGQKIQYDVYLDSSRTQRWGAAQSQHMAANAGADGVKTIVAYGFVPSPSSNPDAGQFTDNLVMTVHF